MSTPTAAIAHIRALILDRRHRCLVVRRAGAAEDAWELPAARIPWPERPLLPVKEQVGQALGLELRGPAGSCVPAGGASPRDFAFVLRDPPVLRPDPAIFAAARWAPISQAIKEIDPTDAEALWRIYVDAMLGGYEPPRQEIEAYHFGDSPELAAKLAHLVVKGRKRATTGWIEALERADELIPRAGMLWVVTDYFGYPQCVTETVEVLRVPFGEVPEDIARGEGEGDLTYADWREAHLNYFRREAEALGIDFNDRALMCAEVFRVLRVLGQAD